MPNILIIEDEATFREFMSLALNMEGYHVESVSSGEAALRVLNEKPPDLVMLDLSMPDVSGWDILQHIRAMPSLSQLPVVVVTANADEDTRRRSHREHVDSLLVKPVSLDEILAVLENLLP